MPEGRASLGRGTGCQADCFHPKKNRGLGRFYRVGVGENPFFATSCQKIRFFPHFRGVSHFDYVESATDQYQAVIDWPSSRVMTEAGFRDAWRETHPQVDRVADRTWSPRFPEQEQDRIDFVYYRGQGSRPSRRNASTAKRPASPPTMRPSLPNLW